MQAQFQQADLSAELAALYRYRRILLSLIKALKRYQRTTVRSLLAQSHSAPRASA